MLIKLGCAWQSARLNGGNLSGRQGAICQAIRGEMSKTSYHHGNLRTALLTGADALLEEKGAAHLSLREAARKAGVSQTAPYRHFASKEALMAALAAEAYKELAAAMTAACRAKSDAPGRLHALGGAYVDYATSNPQKFRLMFGPEIADVDDWPDTKTASDDVRALIENTVGEYLDARRIRMKTQIVPVASAWSLIHGLAMLMVEKRMGDMSDQDRRALVTSVTGFFVTGG